MASSSTSTSTDHTGSRSPSPSNQDDHVCSSCGKTFKRKATLVEHEKFVHQGNKGSFHCCGEWFRQPSYFKRHQCSAHRREKSYSCDHCTKTFAIKADLNRHLRHESQMLSYKCSHGDQVFESKQRLRDHEGIHTGAHPAHQCPTCSNLCRFKSGVSRRRQLRTHQ